MESFEELKLDNYAVTWLEKVWGDKKPEELSIKQYIHGRGLSSPSGDFLKAWVIIQKYGYLFKKQAR